MSYLSQTVSCWNGGKYPKPPRLSSVEMAGNVLPLPKCHLLKWREMPYLSPTVNCWNGGKCPTSPRLSTVEMAGNVLPLPDCQLLKMAGNVLPLPDCQRPAGQTSPSDRLSAPQKSSSWLPASKWNSPQHWTVWKGCSLVKNSLVLLGTHGYFFLRSDHINQFFLCMRKWFSMSFKSFPIPYTIINFLFASLRLRTCSATTPVSDPTSLRNFPNGCQGHPRSYPPPDRPSCTKPDSNSVRTRLQIFIRLWHRLTKNA